MVDKATRLKFRRMFKRRKKVALDVADQAEEQLERLFFKRLVRLARVRRFVFSWVSLLVLLVASVGLQVRSLSPYYQTVAPIEGGTIREGMVGTFTNINPLYATTIVDSSLSHLVFSGLFTHDDNNQLVSSLAEKWESDENGQVYTVSLRKNIKWHDGKPLTANDVVYTYTTIQKPDAKSPFLTSWQGVVIQKIDDFTVTFRLPSPLAAFPYSLTNGIVPQHILEKVPAGQLRSVPFNTTEPIGTGPFKWKSVEVSGGDRDTRSEQIALVKNDDYFLGAPKVDQYVLKTFKSEDKMLDAYVRRELTAIVGLDSEPNSLKDDTSTTYYNVPTDSSVMIFMNNSSPLLQDAKLRQALSHATNKAVLLQKLQFSAVNADGPFLKSQSAYNPSILQRSYNIDEANKLLDEAGWVRGETGVRKKADVPLKLRFVSQNITEYTVISQELQKQWQSVGVELDVTLRPEEDMQRDVLARHDYDVLLYGIAMGIDPDVFAYWHSTQADVRSATRLNLSEYKSAAADKSLEAGRTRVDTGLRSLKYKPFLQAWVTDAPAIALYQPRFLYISRTQLVGFKATRLNSPVDRFNNVQNWTVLQDKILK